MHAHRLSVSDTRVDECIEHVNDKIGDDVDRGDEQEDAIAGYRRASDEYRDQLNETKRVMLALVEGVLDRSPSSESRVT
jgi:hypothetical protein